MAKKEAIIATPCHVERYIPPPLVIPSLFSLLVMSSVVEKSCITSLWARILRFARR